VRWNHKDEEFQKVPKFSQNSNIFSSKATFELFYSGVPGVDLGSIKKDFRWK
jgi:hypothetical protein